MGFGILRFLTRSSISEEGWASPRISFNFLGHYGHVAAGGDQNLEVGVGGDGESVSGQASLLYDLEWNAIVLNGQLRIVLGYAEGALNDQDIEVLVAGYRELLVESIGVVQG